MNKLLLTGLAISWRVDYDEKGEAKSRHVAISADAREVAPFGRRLGANVMMSETLLEQVKVNETLFNSWVDAESKHIVKGFALKGSQLGLEVSVPDMLIHLREQLSIGLKRFCENDMPWYHTFYLIKTIKPGETWLNEDGTPYREVTEPEVVVIKAD
jgi:hypothetical protein